MEIQNYDQKLEEIKNLEKENNEMLKGIKRSMAWDRFFGVIRWVIIIGGTVGVYYYFQPLIDRLWDTYNQVIGTLGGIPKV